MAHVTELSSQKCWEGYQKTFSHHSDTLDCKMTFGVYIPPKAVGAAEKCPVLYWLSGLTCTEQTLITKGGFQRYAAEHNVIVVNPDTSPRGCGIEGEDDSWDFGTGAGFYLDATEEKWRKHYNMYSYITKELPAIVEANFPVIPGKRGIFGHSMGGHGALICYLKNPDKYTSVSAFAPICNPVNCDWGKKAFNGYLGSDLKSWENYDACHLVQHLTAAPKNLDILIDQGTVDEFLPKGQLLPENFVEACKKAGVHLSLRNHKDYDHSYYFISTFIGEHFAHHMKFLK